ncbi:hypothetical protein FRB99_007784 [Tulasnella sp. 403]|nr:hypothetical protein FRB99_007784 [Tulasnella sp. 403]
MSNSEDNSEYVFRPFALGTLKLRVLETKNLRIPLESRLFRNLHHLTLGRHCVPWFAEHATGIICKLIAMAPRLKSLSVSTCHRATTLDPAQAPAFLALNLSIPPVLVAGCLEELYVPAFTLPLLLSIVKTPNLRQLPTRISHRDPVLQVCVSILPVIAVSNQLGRLECLSLTGSTIQHSFACLEHLSNTLSYMENLRALELVRIPHATDTYIYPLQTLCPRLTTLILYECKGVSLTCIRAITERRTASGSALTPLETVQLTLRFGISSEWLEELRKSVPIVRGMI